MNSDELPSYLKSIQNLLQSNTSGSSLPVVNAPMLPTAGSDMISRPAPSTSTVVPVVFKERDPKKLQFLMVSTHCHQFTGYSKVSYGVLQQLSKLPWIQLTHFGFQKFHTIPPQYRPYPSNVEVLDAAAMEKPIQQGFGFAQLPDIIRKKQPHVVMIYNDLAVVARFLEEIRKSGIPRNFKIWVYCDQVYNTQLQGYLDILNRDADQVFVFSTYWKKCLKGQGITRPIEVIQHGFDSSQFFPIPKELARKQLNLPTDAFIFLNLNRNQPRKRLDLMIMAFVELICKYPTKPIFLMSITDKGEKGGWWLFEIYKRELEMRNVPIELFGNRLMISTQDMSFSDNDINLIYNLADCGLNTSDGEGWGLCNFEQMGCGVPQVVPDIGGFKEFCSNENTMLVKPRFRYYMPMVQSPVGGEALACDPHDICLAMEEYINDSEKRLDHGKKARESVLKYTWAKSVEKLVKRLEEEKKEVFEE
jgi:glycosyltransferase involved in cell wall biosynthesis